MLLDVSAPQIGAPAAWDAGLTGAGVTVAVLDSGIAADHPDFAGRIAEARSFLDGAPDAVDDVGHGTHVASILAGSGAGSGGRYRGVAPDAQLVIGKVCDLAGCPDSALLAGMEWAAASGAAVINISLGGPDTPEVDPLEQAIDALTAEHGALFVVSAGNIGLCGGGLSDQVGSPSTADAALSVAAVDAADQVADFSCRGPRAGDGAIKPDIAAPGVTIAAALATGTVIGEPVDDLYTRLSGTSMAAPHAAGAAALLAQLHPEWSAAELKAALMGSATDVDDPDVFRRGAGRVDVARAIEQDLFASPASLSLGRQRWPHGDDEPIARTVTYRNGGDAPLALQLAFAITGPDGAPVAPGMFAVEPAALTVPPGGEASATVTVDTRVAGPDGVHAGVLVASGDQTVRTPIAVDREAESYDLELVHIDRAGAPGTAFTLLFDLDSGDFVVLPEATGTTTLRLRRGRFHLSSSFGGIDTGGRGYAAVLVQPLVDLRQDVSVVLDARLASPIAITVPRGSARRFVESVDYVRYADAPVVLSSGFTYFGADDPDDTFGTIYTAHLGPPVAADTFRSLIQSVWGDPGGAARRFDDSTYGYHLVFIPEAGRFPTGWTRRIRQRDVATVHADYAAEGQGFAAEFIALAAPRGDFASHLVPFWRFRLPMNRTEYYTTEAMDWEVHASQVSDDGAWRSDFLTVPPVTYVAGRRHHTRWNGAVLGPAVRSPETSSARVARLGNQLLVDLLTLYSDGADHLGFSSTQSGTTRVYRDGTLIGESDQQPAFALVDVLPEPAAYRVEVEALRGGGAELSSEMRVTWTFRSGHVSDEEVTAVPVLAVRFSPRLDEYNRAPAGRLFPIPITVQRQGGVPAAPLRCLAVERVSRRRAELAPRPGASLRRSRGRAGPPSACRHRLAARRGCRR